jgi:hypothetical protein
VTAWTCEHLPEGLTVAPCGRAATVFYVHFEGATKVGYCEEHGLPEDVREDFDGPSRGVSRWRPRSTARDVRSYAMSANPTPNEMVDYVSSAMDFHAKHSE